MILDCKRPRRSRLRRRDTQAADAVNRRGIAVEHGDTARPKDAVVKLTDNPAERKRLGEAGGKYAMEHWSQEKILQQAFAT